MTPAPTPARLRLRRRLLVLSAAPALIMLLVAAKLISVVVAGNAAQRHYDSGDIGALDDDVAILQVFDVIEPANAAFAAGALAVLDDRLEVADAQFSEALARTDQPHTCPARVNLVLVRERRADIDAWEARLDSARTQYLSALEVLADAPAGCFAGNQDADPQRRAIRAETAARIDAKLRNLGTAAPPPPVSPPPAAAALPAAPPPVAAPGTDDPAEPRQLDPTEGDPMEVLRRLLRDAAG
ncbi:hypothetical protein GR927_05115 [Mycolicibacterium sp. 3033]|nr:hypothetical protein [Mycolicibacterium aurantiacum]